MEKAYRIPETSGFYKQIVEYKADKIRAKDVMKFLKEELNQETFVITGHLITGVKKDTLPEKYISGLISEFKEIPGYYGFRKNGSIDKVVKAAYEKFGYKAVDCNPMFRISFAGRLKSEFIEPHMIGSDEKAVWLKVTIEPEQNITLHDTWEEIKLSEYHALKEKSENLEKGAN